MSFFDKLNMDLLQDSHLGTIRRREGRPEFRIAETATVSHAYFWGSRDTGFQGVAPRIDSVQRQMDEHRRNPKEVPYPHVKNDDAIAALAKVRATDAQLDELRAVDRVKSILLYSVLKRLGSTVLQESDFIELVSSDQQPRCLICGSRKISKEGNSKLVHIKDRCIFVESPEFDLYPPIFAPAST